MAFDFKIKLQNTDRGTSDHPDNQSNYSDDYSEPKNQY